jgi:hypothetical protein
MVTIVAGHEAHAAEQAEYDRVAPRPQYVQRDGTVVFGFRDSEALCRAQIRSPYTSVDLSKSIYGWSVRAGSGLQNFALLACTSHRGGSLDGTYAAALGWAERWVAEDPKRRYAFTRGDVPEDPNDRAYLKV